MSTPTAPDDLYNIPQEYQEEMQNALGGEGVRLPFTVTYWRWLTGLPSYKTVGNAPYFGGWVANVEDVDVAEQEYGALPKVEKGVFGMFTLASRDGGEYNVYGTRALAIAVIGKRQRLLMADNMTPTEHFEEGCRTHIQILGLAGYREGNGIKPWGPVVLTARGLSAKAMTDAFRLFETKTKIARAKFAHGIPAWFFYAIAGTFGEKPITKLVGEPGAQSPISPCQLYLPEDITAEVLRTWYIGEGKIEEVINWRKQAQEWLNDKRWKFGQRDEGEAPENGPEAPENWTDEEPAGPPF